jgi:hypothetical protein
LQLGQTTEIVVSVNDPDTAVSALALNWASTAGSFSQPKLADTAYTCDSEGLQLLTLSASDDLNCTSVLELNVECTAR